MNPALIQVDNLQVHFPVGRKNWLGQYRETLKAVDDVSFDIHKGETVGLVGESGSGKTTVGRAILRALDPTAGRVSFQSDQASIDITALRGEALRRFRPRMSLIFQDPYASLNPRMTVRDIIAEPLIAGGLCKSREEIDARVREMAHRCKLNLEHLRRFPHAFSGGQRQRICIARALISEPEFVVCDESVSALDVSIQAEILNLLEDLQRQLNVAFLFIAHDLSVVAKVSTRVAVMYVGRFVEYAPTRSLYFTPRHPYTHALLSAIPRVSIHRDFNPIRLQGEPPNPMHLPFGCHFHPRCPYATERCQRQSPKWREVAEAHFVACHHSETLDFSRPQPAELTTLPAVAQCSDARRLEETI